MKKIILIIILISGNLCFGENLNKYESKRVFDKTMNCFTNGDSEKYKNDIEMKMMLELYCNLEENYLKKIKEFSAENKYKVLEVKEGNNTSILTVSIDYIWYSNISEKELINTTNLIYDDTIEIFKKNNEEEMYIIELSYRVHKKYKNRIKKENKIIQVYMEKIDDFWILNDNNDELIETLYPLLITVSKLENINTIY